MTNSTITPTMTTGAAVRALCALCTLLLHRAAAATTEATVTAINATAAAARRLWHWLTTEQDFSNEEGEIHMTGARYICVYSLVCFVLILLASIGD